MKTDIIAKITFYSYSLSLINDNALQMKTGILVKIQYSLFVGDVLHVKSDFLVACSRQKLEQVLKLYNKEKKSQH